MVRVMIVVVAAVILADITIGALPLPWVGGKAVLAESFMRKCNNNNINNNCFNNNNNNR